MPAPGADASGLPDALVAAMQPDQALLVTAVIDDELLAVIARHDGLVLQRRVARSSDVTASIALLRNQLQILAAGSQRFEQHLPQLTQRCRSALQRLAQQLWAPLAPALAGVQRLLLVPHGELAGLPWSALAGGGDAEAPRPLIVHATSARAALRVLGTGSAWHTPRRVLAWGDSKRLQHAAAEAGGVAALYAEGRALLGEQATRQALLEQGPGAEVLHFACHAHFRRDNPAFSALRLTDGELSAEQVGALRLPAALVVLGGCETNRADPGAADDPVGLVQAFLAAGAERVLAAQWPLHDAPGAALLQALHRGLAAGATPAAALDAAMREVARAHPHPALWAALTLHGRW